MPQHSIFYYPYASLTKEQTLLLKATALYFDKLYMLDPMKASWATIGMHELEGGLAGAGTRETSRANCS